MLVPSGVLGIHTFLFRVLWLWNAESPLYLDLKSSLLELAFHINGMKLPSLSSSLSVSFGYYNAAGEGVAGPCFFETAKAGGLYRKILAALAAMAVAMLGHSCALEKIKV